MRSTRSAVYLDCNASAPLRSCVFAEFQQAQQIGPFLNANPSSIHSFGRTARGRLSDARDRIARSLHITDSEEIILTSSGTESNQAIVRAVLGDLPAPNRPIWVLSPIEHDSVMQMAKAWESAGGVLNWLGVKRNGSVFVTDEVLESLQSKKASLVSATWVNNETGVIQDLSDLALLSNRYGVPFHVDAAQAWGKIDCDLPRLGADYVSLSSHKIGAPAGVGVIWKKPGAPWSRALILGKQEKGRRGGTENALGVHLLGVAAIDVSASAFTAHTLNLQKSWESELLARFPDACIYGKDLPRVSNTSLIRIPSLSQGSLVMALDLEGYSVSSGSACSSGTQEPSHVLLAMGVPKAEAKTAIRVSYGLENSIEDLYGLLGALERIQKRVTSGTERQNAQDSVNQ